MASGQLFHHPVGAIFIAHAINLDHCYSSCQQNNAGADKGANADDVQDCKDNEQSKKTAA